MSVDVVILAAGQGTRMKSRLPKMLHPLGGKPMILHGLQAATEASGRPPVMVVGHGAESVRETVGSAARFVIQEEQLGTGHAVMQARSLLEGAGDLVIVMYCDMPLVRASTLQKLVAMQEANDGPLCMTSVIADAPRGFGRVVRDFGGTVAAIIEEAQATPDQLAIREVNVGLYCFRADWLWAHLPQIKASPKGEYYITDLIEMAVAGGGSVRVHVMDDKDEALGINTRVHLSEAEAALRLRINHALMESGVTIIDPATTYIEAGVTIGMDTVILPNTTLTGKTTIGEDCIIGPDTLIDSSTIGDHCQVRKSVVESAVMENEANIGPFGHLRSGAYLEEGVHMGNFGEVKNSRLHKGVKMGHFSYIGDGDIGEETNIGAGTITCNFDGKNKHKTIVGKNVFIGSDTMLVAPLNLGDGARTGAGSVVTHDVGAGELVVGVPARKMEKK